MLGVGFDGGAIAWRIDIPAPPCSLDSTGLPASAFRGPLSTEQRVYLPTIVRFHPADRDGNPRALIRRLIDNDRHAARGAR
jgi:hypothetical protein